MFLMMRAGRIIEELEFYSILTLLVAREEFFSLYVIINEVSLLMNCFILLVIFMSIDSFFFFFFGNLYYVEVSGAGESWSHIITCVFSSPTECLVSETRPNLSPMGRLYLKADREGKGR
jgi:hypothetical protein